MSKDSSNQAATMHDNKLFVKAFQLPNPNLKAYFGKVVEGQKEVYDTPFARGESTKEMLSAWISVLKSIHDRWPTLYDYEIDLANKVGPMSVMKPLSERMEDIDSYYDGILLPSTPISDSAIAAVKSEWVRARGLRLRGQQRTVELMKKSTNSGSPFFTKRRLVSDKTIPCRVAKWSPTKVVQILPRYSYDVTSDYIDTTHNELWQAAAILGWRGQEGGPDPSDVKQRVVWMFPYAVNVAELQFYQPAIEAAQRFNIIPSWVSMESVDISITRMFDSKGDRDLVVCTDFSKFDQHFNKDLQDGAYKIINSILAKGDESTSWLRDVYPIKYMIPLAYDYGKVRVGSHGMGSGSGGTNFDETLTHRSLQYEAAISAGAKLNPNSQCLGDDGVLTYPGITVEDVVQSYTSHGLEMNPSKQYASTQDCIYLRRWHHRDYRVDGVCAGVYSTCRALGRLRYLERFQNPKFWGPKAVALRQLSIIENCKYHPLKEQFVDFCMKRDKYRLGIDIPDFLANIRTEANKVIENMPDFLGYTKTLQSGHDELGGIENWWIVNYLKSK